MLLIIITAKRKFWMELPGARVSSRTRADEDVGAPGFIPRLPLPFALAVLVWMKLLTPSFAQQFTLESPAKEVHLGETIDVFLTGDDPAFDPTRIEKVTFDLDPENWHLAADWKPMDAGGESLTEKKDARKLWRAKLTAFGEGDTSLPPAKVFLKRSGTNPAESTLDELSATTSSVRVIGVVTGDEKSESLAPMKGLYLFPRGWLATVMIVIIAIAVAALAFLALRRWLRARASRPAPPIPVEPLLPPGAWALREMSRLQSLPVAEHGPVKEIDTLASDLLRAYWGRRHNFSALDMTTYECMETLQSKGVSENILSQTQRFLNECDLVKFSKFEPPRERWKTIWDDARAIILATTPPEELKEAARMTASLQVAEATS